MNKETFLQELAEHLSTLSEEERNGVLDYYREMIYDEMENGKAEEAVIKDFGSPETVAAQIYSDYTGSAQKNVPPVAEKTYSPDGIVNTIQLSAQNLPVTIHRIPEETVRVLFTPLSFDTVTVTEQDSVFTFTQTAQVHFFHVSELFHHPRSITLELPETFSGTITVKTSNARITGERLKIIKEGVFTTSNARVDISKSDCSSLQIHTSNGKVEISDCKGSNCTVKTSNGRITVTGCSYGTELNLHTNNGAINADHISSDRILLKTGNAPINAVITGDARDYAIHSHTINGRNNLPPDWSFPGQSRQLTAETSNAHIDITFTTPAN
jgi:DUF4097 and DUF4098 domain-containing protein YvlB